jgi:uncharacterized membrane protein YjjB (DUF3815 family)
MFFLNDLGFTIYGYVAIAVVGLLIGSFTGFLISIVLKPHVRTLLKDALLGALGSTIGFFVSDNMPWPRNTVTTSIGDHGVSQITMNRFQYPEIVAFAVAALLPVLHQLFYRFRHSSKARVAAP